MYECEEIENNEKDVCRKPFAFIYYYLLLVVKVLGLAGTIVELPVLVHKISPEVMKDAAQLAHLDRDWLAHHALVSGVAPPALCRDAHAIATLLFLAGVAKSHNTFEVVGRRVRAWRAEVFIAVETRATVK